MILIEKALTFALLFGILIFLHELGHFLAAKLFKFKVYEFAFGLPFGKKWRYWHDGETEYTVRSVLLGGFVGFTEADADEPTRERQMEEFHAKPVSQRFWVILAGPLASLLLGYLALVAYVKVDGMPVSGKPSNRIVIADPKMPAAKAGLKTGDAILSVNGIPTPDGDTLVTTIRGSSGQPLRLQVRHQGIEQEKVVNPLVIEEGGKKISRIGIVPQPDVRPASLGEAFQVGAAMSLRYFQALGAVFQSAQKVKESVGGPIGIAQVVSQTVEEGGIGPKLSLLGTLSLSLFAANLFLPIPVFDGGQILLLVIEGIRRRQLSKEVQLRVAVAGWVMVLALFALVTLNDLSRLFFPKG